MSVVQQQEPVSDQQKVVDKQQGLFVYPQMSIREQERAGADREGGADSQFFFRRTDFLS